MKHLRTVKVNSKNKKKFRLLYSLYLNEISKSSLSKKKIDFVSKNTLNNKKKIKILFKNKNIEVGFIILIFSKNILNEDVCKINDFYIKKNFRKKKIGQAFVKKILSSYRKKKIKKFMIDVLKKNKQVISFWKKFNLSEKSRSYLIK